MNSSSPKNKFRLFSLGFSEERFYFIENFVTLVESGITIPHAFSILQNEMRTRKMYYTIQEMLDDFNSGLPLWKVFERSHLFSQSAIFLVKTGEEAGKLTQNLLVIVKQQQNEQAVRSKIRSALIYPVIIFIVTIIIGLGLAWFVLPRLAIVFSQLNVHLPLLTRVLINIGAFLKTWGLIFVPGAILLIFLITYFLFINRKTKFVGERLLFSLPRLHQLIQESEISRMGFTMGVLLKSGIPIITSVTSLIDSTDSKIYKKFYSDWKNKLEQGSSFKKIFEEYGSSGRLIPIPIQQMIISGEQSGKGPEVFSRVGEIFENKVEETARNFSAIIEPLLLIFVWIFVLLVAIAIFLPIYSLESSLR